MCLASFLSVFSGLVIWPPARSIPSCSYYIPSRSFSAPSFLLPSASVPNQLVNLSSVKLGSGQMPAAFMEAGEVALEILALRRTAKAESQRPGPHFGGDALPLPCGAVTTPSILLGTGGRSTPHNLQAGSTLWEGGERRRTRTTGCRDGRPNFGRQRAGRSGRASIISNPALAMVTCRLGMVDDAGSQEIGPPQPVRER